MVALLSKSKSSAWRLHKKSGPKFIPHRRCIFDNIGIPVIGRRTGNYICTRTEYRGSFWSHRKNGNDLFPRSFNSDMVGCGCFPSGGHAGRTR